MVHCIYLCNPKGNCQEVKTLDKYEYNLKLDEIKKLVTSGNYEEAVKVADTVEWKRVRNTRTLCMQGNSSSCIPEISDDENNSVPPDGSRHQDEGI